MLDLKPSPVRTPTGGTRQHTEAAQLEATLRSLLAALRGTPNTGNLDPAQSAVHTTAAVASQAQISEAMAYLTSLRTRFPNAHRVLQKAMDVDAPATLSDFPAPVLVAAVHAAKLQEHGFKVLLHSARAEAASQGTSGKIVVHHLDQGFGYCAAELVELGTVSLDLDPLDMALGVLPLLQIGLHICHPFVY